jgi:hypothetical protein
VVHYGLVIGSACFKLAVVTLVPIYKRNIAQWNGKDYNNLIANKAIGYFKARLIIWNKKIYIKDHKRKWTSIILLICISIMMETIPKQKRPFLCLKVHSYTHKMRPFPYIFVMVLSWPFRDVNKIFLHVLRGIQGLSKAEMTFVGQFTCLNNFGINILI